MSAELQAFLTVLLIVGVPLALTLAVYAVLRHADRDPDQDDG